MKKRIVEIAVKVVVAALTAFLTAITTTSCLGHGPIILWTIGARSINLRAPFFARHLHQFFAESSNLPPPPFSGFLLSCCVLVLSQLPQPVSLWKSYDSDLSRRGQTCKHDGSCCSIGSHDSAIKMQAFIAFAARKFGSYENNPYLCSRILSIGYMEPKIGDRMKVSPQLTDQADWIDGEVIDVEHNPFMGLVISIKDKLGRIFFGQSRFFVAL